jgi:DGQHR domain-containing protein
MSSLTIPAIEYKQGKNRLYTFIVNGKQIPHFASISRLKRNHGDKLLGYQRPQVISHIAEIKRYLESANPMIPNSIVVAFDKSVKFAANEKGSSRTEGVVGTLTIPIHKDAKEGEELEKPGWIVDGQQRMAAIQDAEIKSFAICVVGFIASDEKAQREQFIRVNSAKPLPKDLIDELITETDAVLDAAKQRRKFPLLVRNRLNYDKDSPFRGRIKTPTMPAGTIASSSIIKMVDHSLSNGVLYRHNELKNGAGDIETILTILKNFWKAVATVFPDAWEKPPSKSRLTHGAGIISLGFVMDAICDRFSQTRILSVSQFSQELNKLKQNCSWVSGSWKFGSGSIRKWNEIQNVPKDVEMLANYLVSRYTRA